MEEHEMRDLKTEDTGAGNAEPEVEADQTDRWDIDLLWRTLEERQGTLFYTAKKLPFQYAIRGGEMFVDRRNRSITKSTFARALEKISERPDEIHGPKALNVFGAPYVWAIFVTLGIVDT
jgi:hypothetical protein